MLNLDGLEVIAVLLVMGLFIKVLEQFGMFEPVGGEGNGCLFVFRVLLIWDNYVKSEISEICLYKCVHEPIPSGPE